MVSMNASILKKDFIEPHRKAYLIHIDDQIAEFVLLYHINESKK